MMTDQDAMQMALEALERARPQIRGVLPSQDADAAIDALRARLAGPETCKPGLQAARRPLTEEEIDKMWREHASEEGFTTAQFVRNFTRAIERKITGGDDDGDALRLAVRLGMHISQQLSYVSVMRPHGGAGSHLMQWSEQYRADPYAATRRAITRAAAEIGKGMS